jgi:hydroxymethylglutaryl-CoA lyase
MAELIECPRDAMQGIQEWIPAEKKAAYLNELLKVGFTVLDCGSFVSPKAIPQMQDTGEVLQKLDLSQTSTELSVIVANRRGARDAAQYPQIDYLGFPFSVSATFQQQNTNASIEEALTRAEQIKEICTDHNKKLIIYISMGFGNPFGDEWSPSIVEHWVDKLLAIGVDRLSMADTIGAATPETISYLFSHLSDRYPHQNISAHFHSHPSTWREKVEAAYNSRCRIFESALNGYGGCPMAEDELVGNLATENVISYLEEQNEDMNLNKEALQRAMVKVGDTFPY